MNALSQVSDAARGWAGIVSGRENARECFTLNSAGIVVALATYALIVAGVVGLQALEFPGQSPLSLLSGAVFNMLPIAGLALIALPTAMLLPPRDGPAELLVPGIYLLAATLVLGVSLSYLDAKIGAALLGVTVFLLFRLARRIAGYGIGPAVAYAVLTGLVLVALPISVYMLIAPGPGPI